MIKIHTMLRQFQSKIGRVEEFPSYPPQYKYNPVIDLPSHENIPQKFPKYKLL
jgi:hypothetical protein